MNNVAATQTPKLLTVEDVENLPDLLWLAEGILPKPCLAVLYGEPGSGKSFVALSLALTVTLGGPWLGKATERAKVLYIAAEGVLGLKNRIAAHKVRWDIESLNVRFLPRAVNIMDEDEVGRLIRLLKQKDFNPDCIIIDTLARVTVGADENSAKDMGKAIAELDRLKNETGAAVLVIHHTRKGGDSERGSSALRGAADVMILCEATECLDGPAVRLTSKKMKDAEPFRPINAKLERVDLGLDKTSLVLGEVYEGPLGIKSHHAGCIIELLEARFADGGATTTELQRAFIEAGHGSESTFDRAWRDLKGSEKVRAEKVEGKIRYFPVGVSVKPVS